MSKIIYEKRVQYPVAINTLAHSKGKNYKTSVLAGVKKTAFFPDNFFRCNLAAKAQTFTEEKFKNEINLKAKIVLVTKNSVILISIV